MGIYPAYNHGLDNPHLPPYSITFTRDGGAVVEYDTGRRRSGRVRVFPEGVLVTKFSGLGLTDADVQVFTAYAVRLWRIETDDYTTKFQLDGQPLDESRAVDPLPSHQPQRTPSESPD